MNATTATAENPLAMPAAHSNTRSATRHHGPGPRGMRFTPYAIISGASTILALLTASECHSVTHPPSLIYGAVLWGWWGLVASSLWRFREHLPLVSRVSLAAGAAQAALATTLGLAHLLALWSLGFPLGWGTGGTPRSALPAFFNTNRFGLEVLIYGFVLGVVAIVHYRVRVQREALKSLELQRQLSAAHLRALQMQLEPHFLFNTLNAITTLVELGRQPEAAAMLGHLNAILKSTLKRTTPEKVPLSQELAIVENYLAIEQVRFADRLRIEIKVEPAALDSLVPCFLLQPIVENAIRHGIAHCENNGLVEASARRDGNSLRLEVRDTGSGPKGHADPGNGIGLKNTRERLAHFYHDAYDMRATPLQTGGFQVSITIPYERN